MPNYSVHWNTAKFWSPDALALVAVQAVPGLGNAPKVCATETRCIIGVVPSEAPMIGEGDVKVLTVIAVSQFKATKYIPGDNAMLRLEAVLMPVKLVATATDPLS